MVVERVDKSKLPPYAVSQSADRQFRLARRIFIAETRHHLELAGIPNKPYQRGTRLAWGDPDGRLGVVRLFRYLYPSPRDPHAPSIFRVSINTNFCNVPRGVLRTCGVDAVLRCDPPHIHKRLELSLLPEELSDFTRWVTRWIIVRHGTFGGRLHRRMYHMANQEVILPPRPFAAHHVNDPRFADYLWTEEAWRVGEEWRAAKEERENNLLIAEATCPV